MPNTTSAREHYLVAQARSLPLDGAMRAEDRLNCLLIAELRSTVRGRGLVSEYRDLIAAHEIAEGVLAERRCVEQDRPVKALQIPALPAPGGERQKVRLVLPGRAPFPALTQAEKDLVLGVSQPA